MTSKRTIEKRLDELTLGNTLKDYPQPSLAELLSADEVRVKEGLEDAVVLLVDGEEMAVTEEMFGEFWMRDLEQAGE